MRTQSTWAFNARFVAGVFTCLVRPSGWRNPYTGARNGHA